MAVTTDAGARKEELRAEIARRQAVAATDKRRGELTAAIQQKQTAAIEDQILTDKIPTGNPFIDTPVAGFRATPGRARGTVGADRGCSLRLGYLLDPSELGRHVLLGDPGRERNHPLAG